MGNEIMGNNNVSGQQVSEETAHGVDKIIEPSNGSAGLNNTNSERNNENDGTEDVDMSKSSEDPIISNGEDEQVASDQKFSSAKIEGLDEKNRSSTQDSTSTQNDQGSNLPKEDDETLKKEAIETTVFSTEIISLVSTTIVTSNKDSSSSTEKIKQLVHETKDRSGENTESIYKSLLEESIEETQEGQEESSSHEYAPVGGNLAGEDTVENLQQGYIEVPTVEDKLMAMQGETTSSAESIVGTYLDADDSEIKEVVIEDKPEERGNPPDVQPLDGTNIERSKDNNMEIQIPHDNEEITAISKTATVKLMIESDEALEDDKNIPEKHQDEDIPEYTSCDNVYNGEVVAKFQSSLKNPTAINVQELGKHEQSEREVASRQISGSVTATVEQNGIERIYMEEGIVDKIVAVQNLADDFAVDRKTEEYDGNLVSLAEVNGKDFTGVHSSSSDHLLTVNEEKVQREVNGLNGIEEFDKETVKEILEQDDKISNVEGLGLYDDVQVVVAKEGGELSNLPRTTPSTPLQLPEDIDKNGYIIRGTQETMTSSQGDQSQHILHEEHEVVKLENGEILRCMQLVEDSSNIGVTFTDGFDHEKVGANTKARCFTFEANKKEVAANTTAAAFTAEYNHAEITTGVDKATDEWHPLHTSTPGREAGEETPLLQRAEDIGFSSSTEQHNQIDVEILMTDIAVMQFKVEAEEESEKSPLLSPREPSGGDSRVPNPFQSLLTEGKVGMQSPLKEQESNTKSNVMVSSPRSKEKQKPRSSLFTSCLCCNTATN